MFRKTLFVLLTLTAIPVAASDQLEPSMNGGVSASGSYPSQQMEDLILGHAAQGSTSWKDAAIPDDDEETCWVAPEWRDAAS